MNVQKEERVEDSLELLMGGEEGEIVEDSFDKIREQDDNEEEVSSRVSINIQKEERVEDSLELLMEQIVEDSFDKIQEQDDNE
ncbi:hypothetical protein L195_g044963 [Trifolium pratense]|uniref:Uncharacterized protein n=2 Tax=Trifolium pratense TaxID=57577 RepID=A0A2K3MDL8_TRIPR|nr:hypothetical protein L195_g044963 [Trifolium pratense]CAJ2637781.1 unnamed protein product [Trifolium pratense]